MNRKIAVEFEIEETTLIMLAIANKCSVEELTDEKLAVIVTNWYANSLKVSQTFFKIKAIINSMELPDSIIVMDK